MAVADVVESLLWLLVDGDESVEHAALRELHEETGYVGTRVVQHSPTVVCDAGLTTANMQFVVVEVDLGDEEELQLPEQMLDEGEHIERVVVPLAGLYDKLDELVKLGNVVDARLWHWAAGMQFVLDYGGKYGLK